MDLDDLIDLATSIVDEVQEAILGSNIDRRSFPRAFLSNSEVNERLAEGFPSSRIVQGYQLAR